MKKSILLTLSVLLIASTGIFAQTNKRLTGEDVSKLFASTTHVVTTNENIVFDALLKRAAREDWTITPLETEGESWGDDSQSFLLVTRDVFEKKKDDDGYLFLTLLQGRVGAKDIGNLPWIISLPISSDDYESEVDSDAMLSLLVKSIHNHVELIKAEPSKAKQSLNKLYNGNIKELADKTIYMLDEDISPKIDRDKLLSRFNGHLKLVGPAEIERVVKDKEENAVVSHTVKGGYCYKMLIDAADGTIYYYNRDRIVDGSPLYPPGFLQSDISKIAAPFK